MSMVVRTNINSMNANRNLSINNSQVATSLEKLASGYAINRAADDASGLAVSEKMRAQITGLDQGTENALDGVCLIQTAEGAMDEIHNMLNRITELATKSANGTIQDEVDRQAIQAEVDVLIDEIDRIAQATNYNGTTLLIGSLSYYDAPVETVTETIVFDSQLNINESLGVQVGNFTVTGGVLGTDFDYDIITGQLTILSSTDMRIEGGSDAESIVVSDSARSANLALKDVNIINDSGSAFSTGNNDVYIELEGTNELSSTYVGVVDQVYYGSAGLNVGQFGSITIDGIGRLLANASSNSAAIGSNVYENAGNIIINGGIITANSLRGCGIGSGDFTDLGYVGDITITGGTIVATGSDGGAGIGAGHYGRAGNIIITGGSIIASANRGSAGIGSGIEGEVGDITYVEECVTANGGSHYDGIYPDDIGAGFDGTVGTVTTTIYTPSPEDVVVDGNTTTTTVVNGNTTIITTSVITYETFAEVVEFGLILHVADENEEYNKIQVYIDPMTGEALEIKPLYVDTQESAGAAIDKIRNAINYVSTNRGNLGALQNRLERTINNNNNTSENMSSAVSTIKDTDMAAEMMRYTTLNVLTQSAQSMLAQSNQAPQAILSLLG